MTFFFCYWLCTYAIILPKIGKTRAFYCDWLCKNTFALSKIGKIHTFFTVDFLKYAIFVKISCVNTYLFSRSIFFPANFLKCTFFFCNCFRKYTIISPTNFKFCPFSLLVVEKWDFFVVDFFKCVICYVNMQLLHLKCVKFASLHDLFS